MSRKLIIFTYRSNISARLLAKERKFIKIPAANPIIIVNLIIFLNVVHILLPEKIRKYQ